MYRIVHPRTVADRWCRHTESQTSFTSQKIKLANGRPSASIPASKSLFGHCENDDMAFPEVVEKLYVRGPQTGKITGYADNGGTVLKQAAARYLEQVFGVRDLYAETDIIHSMAVNRRFPFCNDVDQHGRRGLDDGARYPIFGTHSQYHGGQFTSALNENHFFGSRCGPRRARPGKVLVLNYPNNPTGASATPNFMRGGRVRRRHGWWFIWTPLTPA
jgi:LL-diaminopimelate aminotransferase